MSSLNALTGLVVSRIEYALPGFSGFLSRAHINRLNAALRKARRWGITIADLIELSDSRLFGNVLSGSHCLNQLFLPPSPASQTQTYNLRPCGNSHYLPSVKTSNFTKSFMSQSVNQSINLYHARRQHRTLYLAYNQVSF